MKENCKAVIIQETDGCHEADNLRIFILPKEMSLKAEKEIMLDHYPPNRCMIRLSEWLEARGFRKVDSLENVEFYID